MADATTSHDDSVVGEMLVALEGAVGFSVRFISANQNGTTSAESQGGIAVTHEKRCYGYLVTSSNVEGETEIPQQNKPARSGTAATNHEMMALFARLLGQMLAQSKQLNHRQEELNAVYRVSAAMSQSTTVDDLLETALRTLIEVVDVGAGSIRLLRHENEEITSEPGNPNELVVRTALNLSQEYFKRGPVIANDSELDMRALAGEMVYVENLATDPRVRFPDLVQSENLHSFLCTGLIFDGQPIGVIRLYTKRLSRRFNEHDQGLVRAAAQQIAAAIANRRLMRERREARQVQRQLKLASNVQQQMLPHDPPSYPGIDLAARCIPSLDLGGDFYDYLSINNHNLGLAIGDVVGKGVGAAIMAASVKSELRAHARYLYDLDEIMERTNRDLVLDTKPNEFATLWYGVIDTETKRLTYCNAGHEPPLVCRLDDDAEDGFAFIPLFTGGMIIGYDETVRYDRDFIDLQETDTLIIFSDGLTDAMNFDDERYTLNRVKQALRTLLTEQPQASARDILNHLLWEVRRYFGFRHQTDDITLLVARIIAKQAE